MDAYNADRERRSAATNGQKKRKNKKLTKDWRFWAALIASAGFITAFASIYQQTGGFENALHSSGGNIAGLAV